MVLLKLSMSNSLKSMKFKDSTFRRGITNISAEMHKRITWYVLHTLTTTSTPAYNGTISASEVHTSALHSDIKILVCPR